MISYIIMPFEAGGYLVRCINALYRQTNDNFEVILSENRIADQKTDEYLKRAADSRRGFKRISDGFGEEAQKIAEALKLIDKSSDYVMFLDVNTVVSPVVTDEIYSAADGENLIIPLAAVGGGEGYTVSECSYADSSFEFGVCDFCYPYSLFESGILDAGILSDGAEFDLFVCSVRLNKGRFLKTGGICLYEVHRDSQAVTAEMLLNHSDSVYSLVEQIVKSEDAEIKATVFEHCFQVFYDGLLSSDLERKTRQDIFKTIAGIGKITEKEKLLNTLFELYMGCPVNELLEMDFGEYCVYRSKVFRFTGWKMNEAEMERMMKGAAREQSDLIKRLENEMLLLRKDVAALSGNLYWGRQGDEGDLVHNVPGLFGEGKLGFRIILKSILAWLKYKIRRKA